MLLIPFSLGIVTWVRVQYCIAVFASTEHFNKGGIWSKLKAGEALTLHAKLKELFITSNTYTVAPSMTSKTILQSATPCSSFMTVGIVQNHFVWPSLSCDLNREMLEQRLTIFHQHDHHTCCQGTFSFLLQPNENTVQSACWTSNPLQTFCADI